MTTYVYRNGEIVEKKYSQPIHTTSVISDNMDPLLHHAAMRVIDSKSEFRRETRRHNCVEVGTEKDYGSKRLFTPKLDNRQRKEDIRRAVYELRNGRSSY